MACKVAGAGQPDGAAVSGEIIRNSVDWSPFFRFTQPADAVELLQREAKRIDDSMTGHAGIGLGELGDFFAHRHVRGKCLVLEHNRLGRRLE